MIRRICAIVALWIAAAPGYAQFGGFGGPSILSRGGGGVGRQGDRPVGFSAFAGVMGLYTNRFNVQSAVPGAQVMEGSSAGGSVMGGLSAFKSERRSSTALQIGANHGRFQRRGGVGPAISTSGFLSLSHSRQLTRRVNWFLGAGMVTTNSSLQRGALRPPASPFGDPMVEAFDPQPDFFDNRVYSASVASGFSFQKSSRLTFSAQGGAFGVERKSRQFQDARGFMGSGAAQYSLTRQTFTGAQYSYGTFYFPGRFGESQYMSVQAFIGRQLNQNWSAQAGAGPMWVHSKRLTAVRLDPFIAELTGQRTALEILDRATYTWSAQAVLSGRYRKAGVGMGYGRGVMPGSALYQTAVTERVFLNYSYSVTRSVSVSTIASATRMKALMQQIGEARAYTFGVSTNRKLGTQLSLSGSASVMRTEVAGRRLISDAFMVNVGLSYAPGELPFHVF